MESIDASIRILIADDNALVRKSLRCLLESRAGWVVCGEATDGREALEKAARLKPNVVLVDLSMPVLDGIAVASSIPKIAPDAEVLIVADHDAGVLKLLLSRFGIRGYVVKSEMSSDLIPAVEDAIKLRSVPASA